MSPHDATRPLAGLKGALRYVRAYRDHVFVVKVGGEVVADAHGLDQVAAQIGLLSSLSIRIVVVHGGGPQATALSRRLGQEPEIVAGRRVTDDAALEVAKMVFSGTVNLELLCALRRHGVQPVGMSGVDADLLTAVKRPPVEVKDDAGRLRTVDYGHVGDIVGVDGRVLTTLLDQRFV
ncbi:MAG: acetylglutamate kinase, partial [Gemmatimonadetes bacterium]|nr:acetylglutamate kinase [Gemmatimonadota bacterium]